MFTQEKPSKSSIHVKRDLYIKVNTSLCYPKKLLKALLKEKKPFSRRKWPAGRPFFGNKGPKKIQQRFNFHLFMLFMQQNPSLSKYMEVLCNRTSNRTSNRISFDNFRFHSTNRLIFNSVCHQQPPPTIILIL